MEIDVNFEGVQFRRNVFLIVEIEKYFSNRLIKTFRPDTRTKPVASITLIQIIDMSEIGHKMFPQQSSYDELVV